MAARKVDDHIEILRKHPFDDLGDARLALYTELKRGGRIFPDDAWRRAWSASLERHRQVSSPARVIAFEFLH